MSKIILLSDHCKTLLETLVVTKLLASLMLSIIAADFKAELL